LTASGIRFNDYLFCEPISLAAWTPPKCPGLFILLISDPNWAPKAFQPLYFGEFGNNTPASAMLGECRPVVAVAKGQNLFVSVLPMPFSTTQQRQSLRNELIRAYNPGCQTEDIQTSQSRDLACQLTAQMMQLIASMNAPVEPVRRRPIGFVNFTEPAN